MRKTKIICTMGPNADNRSDEKVSRKRDEYCSF